MKYSINTPKMAILSIFCFFSLSQAQNFTVADSGWVRIFNGQNFDGLYSRLYGQNIQRPPHSVFRIENAGQDDATIYVSNTNNQGHLATDNDTYSHYRVRIEYRFDVANGNNNAGLTYHTDDTVPRMNNNWPRSIECQMKQSETGSAFSIQQATFTTRASGTGQGSNYVPNGGTIVQACQYGCNGRWYRGNPLVGTHPAWNQMEVVVRGADSAIHRINGQTVLKLWDIRITDNNGQRLNAHDHGGISVQSEGALIRYRRWEIMEFPANTPPDENYLHRYVLDSPDQGETLQGGDTYQITWRTIGNIPNVTLQYHTGNGGWQTIANNVNNTGSYDWDVPNQATQELRVRLVGGPSWAGSDSSAGFNSISGNVGVLDRPGQPVVFSVEGKGILFKDIRGYSQLEILDVTGRTLKSFEISNENIHWDISNAKGNTVLSGLYFFRLSGGEIPAKIARALILE